MQRYVPSPQGYKSQSLLTQKAINLRQRGCFYRCGGLIKNPFLFDENKGTKISIILSVTALAIPLFLKTYSLIIKSIDIGSAFVLIIPFACILLINALITMTLFPNASLERNFLLCEGFYLLALFGGLYLWYIL